MKLLVFGKTGQVATELVRRASDGITCLALGRDQVDLSDPAACARIVETTDADAVINAAAYTAVDGAEDETDLAMVINGSAPAAMAEAAAQQDLPFVHISTDYVFDGSCQTPWTPSDRPDPLGAYGRSKLAGETGVRAAGGRFAILRTSWVFSAHGGNFVKTMLRLGQSRDQLRVVSDQIGGPTAAADIADACLTVARTLRHDPTKSGIYHYAGAPDISWAGFAREIFSQSGQAVTVVDITSADYPTPAARPKNSRLDCASLETNFSIKRPDWRIGLNAVLSELRSTVE